LYKSKIAAEAKVLRETAKEAQAEDRRKAAEQRAIQKEIKEQEKRDRDSQKAIQQAQRGKRIASKVLKAPPAKRVRKNRVGVAINEAEPAPQPPPTVSMRNPSQFAIRASSQSEPPHQYRTIDNMRL
jgi:hypothetical protein